MSGEIECGVIYDDTDTHVDCLAQLPAGSELTELAAHATKSCFEDHLNRRAAYDTDEIADAPFISRDLYPEAPVGQ